MSRVSVVLGTATLLTGCIVNRPLMTHTEVISKTDSTPALGEGARLRTFGEELVLSWDSPSR